MYTKTTLVSLLAISLLAFAGLGYSAFTSSINATGSATAGTLVLGFATPATGGTNTPTGSGGCAFSGTGSSTTLSVTNMAPGDSCTATITVTNSGSLPSSSETTSVSGGSYLCSPTQTYNCFNVKDNLGLNLEAPSNGAGGAIAAGSSFVYSVTVTLGAGSTQQSASGSFTITLTGTVGS